MNNTKLICIASLIICTIMYSIEQFSGAGYLAKTLIKIILFVGVPLLLWKRSTTKRAYHYKLPIILGCAVFVLILTVYWLLREHIDLAAIRTEIETKGITLSTFLFVFIYITFGNSFLEEYFFRGFVYQGMGQGRMANLYSALLFAVYHIGVFLNWFNIGVTMVVLIGLFVGGLIFNQLVKTSGTFLGSWIFHIFADLAIIVIGLRMFGVM